MGMANSIKDGDGTCTIHFHRHFFNFSTVRLLVSYHSTFLTFPFVHDCKSGFLFFFVYREQSTSYIECASHRTYLLVLSQRQLQDLGISSLNLCLVLLLFYDSSGKKEREANFLTSSRRMKKKLNVFIFILWFQERGQVEVKPLEYGEFLYEGKRTLSAKKQYIPNIEEFPDILERVR